MTAAPATAVLPSRTERWVQNLMLAVIAAMCGWVLNTLGDVSEGVANLRPRMEQMEVQLALTYRASDARRDNADTSARISALESRIARLERSIEGARP